MVKMLHSTEFLQHIGLPVLWAISNHEDSDTLKAVLQTIKARCLTALVSTVMTDDGKQIEYEFTRYVIYQ